jgi:hypothetical protein
MQGRFCLTFAVWLASICVAFAAEPGSPPGIDGPAGDWSEFNREPSVLSAYWQPRPQFQAYPGESVHWPGHHESVYEGQGYCDDGCCWLPTVTARVEYLMWWSRGRNVPPLVTTSPQGTPQVEAGVLGFPDTTVLFGDEPLGRDFRSGGRAMLSYLFDDGCTSIDGRVWGLEDGSEAFFATSDGDPILARPFFNAVLGQEDSLLVAFPGITTDGSISIVARNDVVGADAWLRQTWHCDCCTRIDLLAGYQFTRIDDGLAINNIQTAIDPGGTLPVGTVIDVLDVFATQNEFHGGQIGFMAEYSGRCWSLELLGKIALGGMRQRVLIDGRTITTAPGGIPVASPGGLFAQPTNMGTHERTGIAFIPEIGVNLAYDVNPCWRISCGYSLLVWNNVVLAGDQIDRVVNLSQNPGPIVGEPRPRFAFDGTGYWVQGLNFGLEYRW